MFYVMGTKAYLATYDETMKVYPEVQLVRNDDGTMHASLKGGGIAKRPEHADLCTLAELSAQLGGLAFTSEEDLSMGGSMSDTRKRG